MAGARDCFAAAHAAAGRTLSDDELETLFSQAQARIRRYQRDGLSRHDAAARAGADLASEARIGAALRKREAARNALIRQTLDARAAPGNERLAVKEVVAGTLKGTYDAARSMDAQRHAIRDQILGPMLADLRKSGLLQAVRRRTRDFDRDLTRELWRLRDPAAPESGNRFAAAAAPILDRAMETARAWQNEAGAMIGKLDHYVTRQNHDMGRVRGRGNAADYQAWRDFILPRLGPETFDRFDSPDQVEPFLKRVWNNLSSGVHEASTHETLAPFAGPGNLAKQISQERLLHFRNADAWSEYREKFGHGGVLDGVIHGIERAGRDVALMRMLGTNPEAMFKGWVDGLIRRARDRGDMRTSDALKGDWNTRMLDVVTGKADIPANTTLAKIGSTIRVWQQLAKLGGVVLSSLNDITVNAGMLRHNGVPLLESYRAQLGSLFSRSEGTRETAHLLGVGIDGLLRNIMTRFKGDDGSIGKMSRAVEIFHRLNGMTWYSDSLHSAVGLMLTHNLGRLAGRDFAELAPRLQTSLRRYGIEQAEWDGMRGHAAEAADGNVHLLPSEIADPTLASKLQTYVTDQVREGMHEPTAYTRAITTAGTDKGTYIGEAVRLLMQFKNYPITFAYRSLGRELMRDGVDIGGVAHLIAGCTALGYLSMTAKELAKGRNPREPETAEQYGQTIMAAMAQGGGAGIYGDFLFGEWNRFGGSLISSMAGPTAGTIEQASRLFAAIRDGGFKEADGRRTGIGGQVIQDVKNNAPFINIFYARAALDYLIFYRLQEMANPGYLRRYEQNVRRNNGQTFWLSPSAAAP